MIIKILMIYIALMVITYIHELGHMPRKIVFQKWNGIPLPLASAMNSRFRYGGLIATASLFITIYFLNPQIIFLQLIGTFAFLHFVLYTFFGSFNHEIDLNKVAPSIRKYIVLDDVPNRLWPIFIGLSLASFLLFKDYYFNVILNFL